MCVYTWISLSENRKVAMTKIRTRKRHLCTNWNILAVEFKKKPLGFIPINIYDFHIGIYFQQPSVHLLSSYDIKLLKPNGRKDRNI